MDGVYKSVFPIQKLPKSKKNEEWQHASVDAIIGREGGNFYNGKSRYQRMKIDYDLYNGIFDPKDMMHLTNPFNVDDSFPASPQEFNIIRPKINLLIGEETKRPFNFRVISTNSDSASKLLDKKKELLTDYVLTTLKAKTSGEQNDPNDQPMGPEDIEKYLSKEYKDTAEMTAYHSLNYLRNKLNLDHEFMKGWEDALIAGEEIYYVGVVNGEPILERINPLYFTYDKSPDVEFIEEGDWCLRRMPMAPSEIYDRFYDKLSERQLDQLLTLVHGQGFTSNRPDQVNYSQVVYKDRLISTTDPDDSFMGQLINVWHACWKSYKKVGFITKLNEVGEEVNDIVDETYKPLDGETIEWDWVIEVWEGYRIGNDIYVAIQPVEYQSVSIDNPNAKKLPYTGVRHSNINSRSRSLVDIMKPLQYMYIVIWYRLELALARDKGKVINMDVTQIPKSMGIDIYKWMHYLSALGVNLINPYEEGWDIPGREGGKCHIKGTKIIMSDGSLKKVEDLKLFDRVMGPDGNSRTILALHSGVDDMYEIQPSSGSDKQIVNSRHDVYYGKYNNHTGITTFETKTPLELIKQFTDTPSSRDKYFLYRSKGLDFAEKALPIDPYFVGLWLGDGTRNKTCISTGDVEIIKYLSDFATYNNMSVRIEQCEGNVVNVHLTCTDKSKKGYRNKPTNYVKEQLSKIGIYTNKHIPHDYIYNSRENRLQLLAGLIDSDGWYDKKKKRFGFCQVDYRKDIADSFAFIARSLGMKVSVRYKKSKPSKLCKNTSDGAYVVSILSGCEEIPTILARKKAHGDKTWQKDINRTMFNVKYYGKGEYYGFTLDGDSLFLLNDFTISHNSASFNQFSSEDLTMTNAIAQYIQLMDKIEDMVGELSGVTKQRQGSINSSELVGNVERSVVQSSHITEPLFWYHNQAKRRAFTLLLDTAKYAWGSYNKKKLHYMLDDVTRVFLNISEDFSYSDYDIFVTDSTKEIQNIEALRTLMQPAMQNGASLLDVAEIMTLDNMTAIRNKLQEIEDKRNKQAQQAQEQEQQNQLEQIQAQQAAQQAMQEIESTKLELERYKIDTDNQTKIQVAEIAADQKLQDRNANGIPDVLEMRKLDIEERKTNSDIIQKQQDSEGSRREQELKARLAEIQLETKRAEMLADMQLKQRDAQLKEIENQAKLNELNIQNELKQKDLFMKELDSKIKELDLIIKQKEADSKTVDTQLKHIELNSKQDEVDIKRDEMLIKAQEVDDKKDIEDAKIDIENKRVELESEANRINLEIEKVKLQQSKQDIQKSKVDMQKSIVTTEMSIKKSKATKSNKQ